VEAFQDELMNTLSLIQTPMVVASIVTGLGGLLIIGQGLLLRRMKSKAKKDIQP